MYVYICMSAAGGVRHSTREGHTTVLPRFLVPTSSSVLSSFSVLPKFSMLPTFSVLPTFSMLPTFLVPPTFLAPPTFSVRPTFAVLPSFSACLALRRAQRIERDVSEAEQARTACARGSLLFGAVLDNCDSARGATHFFGARGCYPFFRCSS